MSSHIVISFSTCVTLWILSNGNLGAREAQEQIDPTENSFPRMLELKFLSYHIHRRLHTWSIQKHTPSTQGLHSMSTIMDVGDTCRCISDHPELFKLHILFSLHDWHEFPLALWSYHSSGESLGYFPGLKPISYCYLGWCHLLDSCLKRVIGKQLSKSSPILPIFFPLYITKPLEMSRCSWGLLDNPLPRLQYLGCLPECTIRIT